MTVTFVNLGSTCYMLGITFSALHMLTHLIFIITTGGGTKALQSLFPNFGAMCVLEFRISQILEGNMMHVPHNMYYSCWSLGQHSLIRHTTICSRKHKIAT